jgi:hypothetical protein
MINPRAIESDVDRCCGPKEPGEHLGVDEIEAFP